MAKMKIKISLSCGTTLEMSVNTAKELNEKLKIIFSEQQWQDYNFYANRLPKLYFNNATDTTGG